MEIHDHLTKNQTATKKAEVRFTKAALFLSIDLIVSALTRLTYTVVLSNCCRRRTLSYP